MPVLEKAYCGLVTALAMLAGAVLAAITTALVINVVLVSAFTTNIFGMADGIEVGLMAATFLAAPWVLKKNAHVAVSLTPRIQRPLHIVTMSLGAVMSGVLAWSSFQALLIAFGRGSMIQGILVFPEWLVMIPASLSGALLAIEFIRQAIRSPAQDRLQTGL